MAAEALRAEVVVTIRREVEEANLAAVGTRLAAVGDKPAAAVVQRVVVVVVAPHMLPELVLRFTLRVVEEPCTFRGVADNRL